MLRKQRVMGASAPREQDVGQYSDVANGPPSTMAVVAPISPSESRQLTTSDVLSRAGAPAGGAAVPSWEEAGRAHAGAIEADSGDPAASQHRPACPSIPDAGPPVPVVLLHARPLLDLDRRLYDSIAVLQMLAPSADVVVALTTVREWLREALHDAACADVTVDTTEAARALGISRSAVVARIAAGTLPAQKRKGQWRIYRRDLEEQA